MNERVSVVIACYNQACYLQEAVESVLNQAHPACELILVDDGSTDETPQVAARYPAVRYLRQANQGLSAARNTGARASSGDYLVFLDADDRLLSVALEAGLRCFRAHPECALVFGRYAVIAADGTPLAEQAATGLPHDPYAALLAGNFIAMHAAVMYRRALFASGLAFDKSLAACEDYEMYLRVARSHAIAGHETVVAEYRQHPEAMSRDARLMLRSALAVLRSQRTYIGKSQTRRAYASGLSFWRGYYGEHLAREAGAALRSGHYAKAAGRVLFMSRWCPGVLVRAAVARLRSGRPKP